MRTKFLKKINLKKIVFFIFSILLIGTINDLIAFDSYHSNFYSELLEKMDKKDFDQEFIVNHWGNDYVVEEYCLRNNTLKSENRQTSFVVRKKGDDPFLYLIESGLYFTRPSYDFTELQYSYYKEPPAPEFYCLRIDTFVNKYDFSKWTLNSLIGKIIENAKVNYNYVQFKSDPYDEIALLFDLKPSILNILRKGQSRAENFGFSPLKITTTGYSYTTKYIKDWVYKEKDQKDLYLCCISWLYKFIKLQHMKDSVSSIDDSEDKIDFLNFITKCENCLSFYQGTYLSNVFNNIESLKTSSSDDEYKSMMRKFKKYFLDFQNPLIYQSIKQIVQNGLDPQNTFHKLIAYKIINDALLVKDDISYKLFNGVFRINDLNQVDLNQLYQKKLFSQFSDIERFKSFPQEKALFLNFNELQIKQYLNSKNFMLISNCTIEEFSLLVQSALDCLQIIDFTPPSENEYQQYLKESLTNDLHWIHSFSTHLVGEYYLKWFFCLDFILEYDDFFKKL